MKKSLLSIFITFLLVISSNTLAQNFGGGTGLIDSPWQITTKAHLDTIAKYVNAGTNNFSGKYFKMMNDINMSGAYTPIGYNATHSFQGNFDGNNYKIRNFKFINIISNDSPNNIYIGLFGHTSNDTIKNVSMVVDSIHYNVNKIQNSYYGLLIAYAEHTTIINCNVGDTTKIRLSDIFMYNIIGGMVGYAYYCTFDLSYSLCSLDVISQGDNNYNSIGGLIGKAVYCTINNCYTRNSINADNQNNNSGIGGLVGTALNSTFSNSYSAPTTFNSGFPFSGIIISDTTGSNTTFDNCYYLSDSSFHVITNVGTGLTIDQMLDDSFVDSLNQGQNPPIWDSEGGLPAVLPPISWIGDGSGTESDPFLIRYVKDLIYMSEILKTRSFKNYYLRLENDINFNNGINDSSSYFVPLGNYKNLRPFSGNFNGNRKAFVNYKYNNIDSSNVGIFGYIKNASIKNFGISNLYIKAKDTIGGLVAVIDAASTVDSCFVYGFISGRNNVGGLAGLGISSAPKINFSFTNVCIDANTKVGGIVGNYKGIISNSYSNSEIYSSTASNDSVGGIIGYGSDTTLKMTNVYSVSKIVRNGTNTNFGKLIGNNIGTNTNCYSRDSVFISYTNINPTGFNGIQISNAELRNPSFVTNLINPIWISDYSDNINYGYPIFAYQPQAVKPNSSGLWPTTTASQVVIIKNGVQLKATNANLPECAYVKIENGGEIYNSTNINVFGEINNELYAGKWNLVGLSTYNQNITSLINYADISFKPIVKRFDYLTNNWSINPININNPIKYGEGVLVMPNYSLDAQLLTKSRIISKGVLFNNQNLDFSFNITAPNKFVSLANSYPASLVVTQNNPPIIGNDAGLIQGNIVYVYDANTYRYNNNLQAISPITSIKSGEGFMIVGSTTNGTFKFNKNQIKITSGAKNTIKRDLIYVNASSNNNEREAFLQFNEDAENEFDFEDGLMLFGNNYNSVEPYFTIPNSESENFKMELIKNAFSTLPYTTELDLRSQKNNEVCLNFSNIPSDINVYLIDSLSGKAQYLNENPNYKLQVNEGNNAKRLYVMFSSYKKDINEIFRPEISEDIRVWNYKNNLNIEGKDLVRYGIYDILGNKLLEQEIQNDKFNTQLNLVSGIYIVRAYSKTGYNVQKISISSK